jgi:hypothetical protein
VYGDAAGKKRSCVPNITGSADFLGGIAGHRGPPRIRPICFVCGHLGFPFLTEVGIAYGIPFPSTLSNMASKMRNLCRLV